MSPEQYYPCNLHQKLKITFILMVAIYMRTAYICMVFPTESMSHICFVNRGVIMKSTMYMLKN